MGGDEVEVCFCLIIETVGISGSRNQVKLVSKFKEVSFQ